MDGSTNRSTDERPPSQTVSNVDLPKVKTGIAGSTSNLVNSIVGSGIIGLPYALRESGIIVGLVLLVLVSYFTDKSLRLIVELATFHPDLKDKGVRTFEDLISIPFGVWGSRFILVSMFILAYGAMTSYMIIIKDTVPTVLGLGDSFLEREMVMLVLALVTMLPLSMMRDISQLAFTSSLSVIADIVLVAVVMIHAPIKDTIEEAGGLGEVISEKWVNGRIFIGLGVLSTAMACQHSAFLISGTLENHTSQRWAQVTKLSLWIAGSLSTIFAVYGYLGYLDETQGDILNNFEARSTAVNAGRSLLAVTMIFTYPMESFVARHVLGNLVFAGNLDNTTVDSNGNVVPETKWFGMFGRRELWTFYLFCMTLVPALVFDDIGPVLSLTGSVGASFIAYVGPGLVYLGLNGSEFLAWVGVASSPDSSGVEMTELPVDGDANAQLKTPHTSSKLGQSKPWWWFPCLMPIWVAIASSGSNSSKQFLTTLNGGVPTQSSNSPDVIGPRKRDFIFSIVFITFGLLAAVFGVISNIYVQLNDIFFSPH